MRVRAFVGFCFVALAWAAVPAKADVQTYCEAYARNQAHAHLSGSAVLGFQPELTADNREKRKAVAFADCLTLYKAKPNIEAAPEEAQTVTADPIPVPRSKPKSIAGAKQETPVVPAVKIEAVIAIAAVPGQKKPTPAATASSRTRSADHRAYCAAKYASYNPATDTYTSLSGQQRPCLVAKSQPVRAATSPLPARGVRSQVPARPAKSELPTRAATSEPPATAKSPWDSFDNPGLKVNR